MTKEEMVYQMVMGVPEGKVTTYGKIGKAVGINPRMVGRILHNNPDNSVVPCHRVVKTGGSIASGYAFGGEGVQRKILKEEGVKFVGEKVASECIV